MVQLSLYTLFEVFGAQPKADSNVAVMFSVSYEFVFFLSVCVHSLWNSLGDRRTTDGTFLLEL